MTKFHPLWPGGPTPEETAAGQAAAARMAQLESGTGREAAYVEAVQAFYAGEGLTFRERLAAWACKQRELGAAYPDDLDAAAFDALAQLTMAAARPRCRARVARCQPADGRIAGQRAPASRRISLRDPRLRSPGAGRDRARRRAGL